MPQIFVIGDSHTRALKTAVPSFDRSDMKVDFHIHWRKSIKNGVTRGDMELSEAKKSISNLQAKDMLVISIFGTMHNIIGLIKHSQPFYTIDSKLDKCNLDGYELIPANCMQDLFYNEWEKINIISDLKSISLAPVYHLMPPPPKEKIDCIKSKTSKYRGSGIDENNLNRSDIKLALWRLEMEALELYLNDIGVKLIKPPNQSLSEHGYLKEDYYAQDATHANAQYGLFVLNQLADILKDNENKPHLFQGFCV